MAQCAPELASFIDKSEYEDGCAEQPKHPANDKCHRKRQCNRWPDRQKEKIEIDKSRIAAREYQHYYEYE